MENYDCAGESFFSNNLVLVLPGAGASEADEDVSCEGVLNVSRVWLLYHVTQILHNDHVMLIVIYQILS